MAWSGGHILAVNTAEGGTHNTAVSTGNSGGASGDSWDAVSTSGSSTAVYSSTDAIHGDLSYLLTANGGVSALIWTDGTVGTPITTGKVCFAAYITPVVLAASSSPFLLVQQSGGGGDRTFDLRLMSTGVLRLAGVNSSSVVDLSASPLSTGNVYRVEAEIEYGGGDPAYWVAVFAGDSDTPLVQASGTSSNIGGAVGRLTWGRVQSPDFTMRMDCLGLATDRLGPYEVDEEEPEPEPTTEVAYVGQATQAVYSSAVTVAYSSTAGNTLLLWVSNGDAVVTDSASNDWTLLGATLDEGATSQRVAQMWICQDAAAVTSVTATGPGGNRGYSARVIELSGVGSVRDVDVTNLSVPSAASVVDGLAVVGGMHFDLATSTPAGYTGLPDVTQSGFANDAAYKVTTGATESPSFGQTNVAYVLATFAPVVDVPPTNVYVRVSGEWVPATPHVRVSGEWVPANATP